MRYRQARGRGGGFLFPLRWIGRGRIHEGVLDGWQGDGGRCAGLFHGAEHAGGDVKRKAHRLGGTVLDGDGQTKENQEDSQPRPAPALDARLNAKIQIRFHERDPSPRWVFGVVRAESRMGRGCSARRPCRPVHESHGGRPEALRPTLSDGLPLSGVKPRREWNMNSSLTQPAGGGRIPKTHDTKKVDIFGKL